MSTVRKSRFKQTDQTRGGSTWSPLTDPHPPYSSRELAALLQLQFDEENRLLLAERAELAATAQRVFDCGVCMDTLPQESIARFEPCGHPFCRDCVRGFVASQIESRRFPVLCPTCTAEPGNNSESIGSEVLRYVEGDLWLMGLRLYRRGYAGAGARHWHHGGAVRNVDRDGDDRLPHSPAVSPVSGVVQNQSSPWRHLTVTDRCTHTSFFDKEEFEETRDLKCPHTDCNYVWCKACQQEIIPGGPEHSCDGSAELKHLVQEQGWKYCPSKFIPIPFPLSYVRE